MKNRGYSLLEALMVLAVASLLLALTSPHWQRFGQTSALKGAALRLLAEIQRCQNLAAQRSSYVGLLFHTDEKGTFFVVVRDGNGNGVSRSDFLAGRDPVEGGPWHLRDFGAQVSLGPPPGLKLPTPDGHGTVPESGLALGPAKILSFSPGLGARSGSIYLSAGRQTVALRVAPMGASRLFRWSSAQGKWLPFGL